MNAITQQCNNLPALKEARLQLALQAIKEDGNLSERRAAAVYNVTRTTLVNRRARKQSRRDCTPKAANLRPTEEEVIVQHNPKVSREILYLIHVSINLSQNVRYRSGQPT